MLTLVTFLAFEFSIKYIFDATKQLATHIMVMHKVHYVRMANSILLVCKTDIC